MPDRPAAADGAARPQTDVVIGVVVRDGRVLICQRPDGKSFGGYWEFPGGKREPGESIEDCLRRELREELAIDVTPLRALRRVDHDYPQGRVRLHPYLCALAHGEPQPLASQKISWVMPGDLPTYRFPPANDGLILEVIACVAGMTLPPPTPAG